MPSKKYAISTPAATTAMWYGKNVSQGILAMERVIIQMEKLHKQELENLYDEMGGA